MTTIDTIQKQKPAIRDHLRFLYEDGVANRVWDRLRARLSKFAAKYPEFRENVPAPSERLTERDAILITYGNQVSELDRSPLVTLAEILETYAAGVITGVHLLPFFPYSSDDGFSVIDYARVNPDFGSWSDIARLGRTFRLMFDAVINHISRESTWFQAFLAGDPEFEDAFIVVKPDTDLSKVVRPRALPLLTAVQTVSGERLVWTTFSTDQIDLNFADPNVLLRIVDLLLLYVTHGAEIIRLDAIAYLWKKIGTTCIHLEETHRVVRLFRAVLDAVAPGVMLITETNVPHEENISYFGDGTNEAQLVYQFPLPPLVMHTLSAGDATHLTEWARDLSLPSNQTAFYNFLASHDGIGVRPVEGILTPDEVRALVDRTQAHGGHVSFKTNPDGSESVYELNISYFDAISDPQSDEPLSRQVDRFMVSQAVMLALQGVPAIYVHSFFGSRNDYEGVERTGRYRSINRETFDREMLESDLNDPESLRARVYRAYRHLLDVRKRHAAFHPNGPQRILDLAPGVFTVLRIAPDDAERIVCLHNVTATAIGVVLDDVNLRLDKVRQWYDLLDDHVVTVDNEALEITLRPYHVVWLKAVDLK